jgi:hypothetical protein
MNLCVVEKPVDLATEILGEIGRKRMLLVQRNLGCHRVTGHTGSLCQSHHQKDPTPYRRQTFVVGAHTLRPNESGHLESEHSE